MIHLCSIKYKEAAEKDELLIPRATGSTYHRCSAVIMLTAIRWVQSFPPKVYLIHHNIYIFYLLSRGTDTIRVLVVVYAIGILHVEIVHSVLPLDNGYEQRSCLEGLGR